MGGADFSQPTIKRAAMDNVSKILSDKIGYGLDEYAVLQDADALIVCTEWSLFRTPDFDKMKSLMKNKVIFDGRNLFDLKHMEDMGFYYVSVGRRVVNTLG